MNKIDLNGRCAVVTGGAQGFGAAIAERFAASAPRSRSGSRPAARGKDRQGNRQEIGSAVTALKVDVTISPRSRRRATRR